MSNPIASGHRAKAARRRRLARFRSTARRGSVWTASPSRGDASGRVEGATNTVTHPRLVRLPSAYRRRNSWALLIARSDLIDNSDATRLRPTDGSGPLLALLSGLLDPLWSSCGRESRASACGAECSAERFAWSPDHFRFSFASHAPKKTWGRQGFRGRSSISETRFSTAGDRARIVFSHTADSLLTTSRAPRLGLLSVLGLELWTGERRGTSPRFYRLSIARAPLPYWFSTSVDSPVDGAPAAHSALHLLPRSITHPGGRAFRGDTPGAVDKASAGPPPGRPADERS